MARLPSFRRIVEQDYPVDDQPLIKQLSVSLNYGIEVLYDLLNGKLTFADNLASTVKAIQVTVNASGIPTSKTSFNKSSSDRILGLMVVKVENLTNSTTYPTSGVFITYTETSSTVFIDHITGLTANNLYNIQVIAIR